MKSADKVSKEKQANTLTSVAKLLQAAVQSKLNGHTIQAIDSLQDAQKRAQAHGQAAIAGQAAALLALMHYDSADYDNALKWLKSVQPQLQADAGAHWIGLLTSLKTILLAHAAALEARRKIDSALVQLTDEISILEHESQKKANELWQALLDEPQAVSSQEITHPSPAVSSKQPDLIVHLLGRFSVQRPDGTEIKLCSNRKGQSIFRMMATRPGRRFHRETLLSSFWKDEDPQVSLGKLHVAISRLRRSLVKAGFGEDVLQFADDSYFFMEGLRIESDLERFQAHLEAGQQMEAMGESTLAIDEYEAAVKIYRGEYLADAVGEDWPLPMRARLEQQYLELLFQLAQCYYHSQRYQEAEETCRALLRKDNLREDVYRQLMCCLSRRGQRAQALMLYQELEQILRAELGVLPMGETTELMINIRDEQEV
jgi:DNA-binding SARP family transcriptional activator